MANTTITPSAGNLKLTTSRPIHIVPGLCQARSGVARSGCAYSGDTSATVGWFEDWTEITVAGNDVTSAVLWDDFQITQNLSATPSTMSFRITGRAEIVPRWGHPVEVWLGGTGFGVPLFGGTITSVTVNIRRITNELEYLCEATDWRWMLDRTSLVSATYANISINTLVHRLVNDFTDSASGFTVGYITDDLGTLETISFDGVPVSAAISKVAEVAGGQWVIEPTKRITMFGDDSATATLTDRRGDGRALFALPESVNGASYRMVRFENSVSDYANKVVWLGTETDLSAAAREGDTSIEVEDVAPFTTGGGTLRLNDVDLAIPAQSLSSGAGTIQLTDPVTRDSPAGSRVIHTSIISYAAKQTEAADRFGDGQDGVVVRQIVDQSVDGVAFATLAASVSNNMRVPTERATVSVYENGEKSYTTSSAITDMLSCVPGRETFLQAINSTTGVDWHERNLVIRQVAITYRANRAENGNPVYERRFTADTLRQEIQGLLLGAFSRQRGTAA